MAEKKGISLELRKEALERALEKLATVTDDLTDAGRAIAMALEKSVRQNFEEGGRPDGWRPSKRAREQGGKTLVNTERLKKSITGVFDRANGRVVVGTNVEYAAPLHFGIDVKMRVEVREHERRQAGKTVTVAAHKRNIHLQVPARPFMMMQDEDWETVGDIIQVAIEEALNG